MENDLDLTLRLGLPSRPTGWTHLSVTNVAAGRRDNNNGGGEISLRRILGDDVVIKDTEGARNNVDMNIRVYQYVFQKFAGLGETLNFAPIPMPSSPAPSPVTPTGNDYVLLDVPARRAHRNKSLAMANADLDANANADAKRRRCHGGFCGGCGQIDDGKIKCTNMNCNAISTPMWRRGPLGPKTLCNACGIKFRKEEERRSKRN
ncbi:unnamed protein product [Arabis nemorensis]|uniref:GATA-type domain-containing protein n=1 Tax=Arabis nemorensis TaxID=586526 RepID=A0A565BCA9_9BRAS|nr:unnamed protein product [Arabis nemorensis]